jgi:hypothetical protein
MPRRPQPGTIPTTAQNVLKAEAILRLMCANCDREAKADLAAIVKRGLGDVPITELKFRCSACSSRSIHPHLSSASADRFRPKEGWIGCGALLPCTPTQPKSPSRTSL